MKPSIANDIVARVMANWSSPPLDAQTAMLWVERLTQLPVDGEVAKRAVNRFIDGSTERFRPVVGVVLAAIIEEADTTPDFEDTWAEMRSKAELPNLGEDRIVPEFSHPLMERFALALPWHAFQMSNEDDTYFIHASKTKFAELRSAWVSARVSNPELLWARRTEALPATEDVRQLVDGIGGQEEA